MIKAENISKAYAGKSIFSGISLNIDDGERVAVFGVSGTGKTTLMRVLTGLEAPDSGSVSIKDGVKMTYVFQEDRLFPGRSVLANMKAITGDRQLIDKYLELCMLSEEKKKKVSQLSGGMSRRLAIARALAYGGELFCLDEPLQELDLKTGGAVLSLLRRELIGKTAIIITHSPREALTLASRVIVVSGSPARITADMPVSQATEELLTGLMSK